jgi:hypothetical protein
LKHYLIKYRDNWADEMNVEGTAVLSEDEYLVFKKAAKTARDFYFSIGSNQDIHYEILMMWKVYILQ